MIQYEVQLNQGNEALQTGKTITANEVLLTCDEKALAREIHRCWATSARPLLSSWQWASPSR